jgi:hypothetical protein
MTTSPPSSQVDVFLENLSSWPKQLLQTKGPTTVIELTLEKPLYTPLMVSWCTCVHGAWYSELYCRYSQWFIGMMWSSMARC